MSNVNHRRKIYDDKICIYMTINNMTTLNHNKCITGSFPSNLGSFSPLSIETFGDNFILCIVHIYVLLILRIYQETESDFLFHISHLL